MMIMVKVMATKEMIKCFTFGKEEREKQKWAKGKVIMIGAIFGLHSRHHRRCEWFRIDSHTIKRENLWLSGYRVPLGDMILAYAFRYLVC